MPRKKQLIKLIETMFTNINDNEHSYGFRMEDETETAYHDKMSPAELPGHDLPLLKYVWEHHSRDGIFEGFFVYIIDKQVGIEINGIEYNWKEIKDILV